MRWLVLDGLFGLGMGERTRIDHSPVVGSFVGPVLTSFSSLVEGAKPSIDIMVCTSQDGGSESGSKAKSSEESRHD